MNPKPTSSSSRSRRFVSVGSKLAGATIALILIVTAGVYVKLTRYQRENLLQAKELAATAVTRFFADSCSAPVIFNDEGALKDALTTLGRNEDVEYATVWATDSNGVPGRQLGTLERGEPVAPARAVQSLQLDRQPNRVALFLPVRDQGGEMVALAGIAFSLGRENAVIAAVQQRTLAVSGGIAIGLTILLLAIARFAIVRPLGKLVLAAKKLEEGSVSEVEVSSNDEIGQLASAFRSMATAIQSREERINLRNRDMKLVLDNVGQGFVTIDIDGRLSDDRSRVVDEWFGVPDGPVTLWSYFARIDPWLAQWFELGWGVLREGIIPLDVCLEQLPHVVREGSRSFEFTYRPIMSGDSHDKTILVITDITSRIERERAEQTQREMMCIFQRMLADQSAFDEFFVEASGLVDAIESADLSDISKLKRQVHTLKGTCALFGIESVAGFCHELETWINESSESVRSKEKGALRALWTEVGKMRSQLSRDRDGLIELNRDDYDAFLDDLRRRVDHDVLVETVASWKLEPASRRLALLSEQVRALATRLGKPEILVTCEPTKLRLPSRKWGPFWSAFAHVIRNTVDHGVESAQERASANKSKQPIVALSVAYESRHVVVTIRDDGRGIDWPAIAQRAKALGLPHATPVELEKALFCEGISSRSDVTSSSGRGVGLGAVREIVRKLGGRIELQTAAGQGTTFRFILPQSMLFDGDVGQPAQVG